AALQAAAEGLSPEHGLQESCREALAALVGIMQLPGAGILLADGGGPVAHGTMRLDVLARAWGDAHGVAPGFSWTRELPKALEQPAFGAEVGWVVALTSPHRHWGHLIAGSGFVAAPLTPDDVGAVTAFAGQLARVLDGGELLARAVAVERSLAHAEKLAAIGEVTARIAHDIRNPVTAARSLAQQLVREPLPFAGELGLVLAELERVERQVAGLLRFSRRDEVRLERVDLTEVVRATM